MKIKTITDLDISLAHSKIQPIEVKLLFPYPFVSGLKKVKINVGSTPLTRE